MSLVLSVDVSKIMLSTEHGEVLIEQKGLNIIKRFWWYKKPNQ